jgi:hypothetical protein
MDDLGERERLAAGPLGRSQIPAPDLQARTIARSARALATRRSASP